MSDKATEAYKVFSFITLCLGIVLSLCAVAGIFWLSKIIPSIYSSSQSNDYSFMQNTLIFHLLWLFFFVSILVAGVRLIISALKKRTKDLVPGLSLYFAGATLISIGLFYLLFQQTGFAIIAILAGILCIYAEGSAEIT